MVRRKPTPTDRKSLPQIYHRWLYQDGVALWHTLSVAVKQQWESDARPFRITGFNYFMRTYLTTLPDLAAGYHLDDLSPTTAIDFSKNANDGVIYGALPTKGLIQDALRFDGIDDYIHITHSPTLNTQETTVAFFIKPLSFPVAIGHGVLDHIDASNGLFGAFETDYLRFVTLTDDILKDGPICQLFLNTWSHIAMVWKLDHQEIYRDGISIASLSNSYPLPGAPTAPLTIGKINNVIWGEFFFHGALDEVRIYNRALSFPEIQRHSERRYPL